MSESVSVLDAVTADQEAETCAAPEAGQVASEPSAPVLSRAELLLQRALAMLLLVLLSPLLLAVAVAVRLSSPGPVLYRGRRVGKGGLIFTMYKFRTLRTGAEREIGARLLTPHDPFYTPIGRFLKRAKLDELPQLFNVLRGDMNLVGPRPVRPVFTERFCREMPRYADRFGVRPGITGLAQVRGGYFTSARAKLRYELLYIKRRSFGLDVKLIALTGLKLVNRWLTLGLLFLCLFLFLSFVPPGWLSSLFVSIAGVRLNVVHGFLVLAAAWLLLKRIPQDRVYVYRAAINRPVLCFVVLSLGSALLSDFPVQALRGAAYYVVTGFLISLLIINGTVSRGFVAAAATVVALTSVGVSASALFRVLLAGYVPAASAAVVVGSGSPGVVVPQGLGGALAAYLVLGVPALLWKVAEARQQVRRDFWVVCTTVACVGILLSKDTVGLIALCVTGGLCAARYFRRAAVVVLVPLLAAPALYLAVAGDGQMLTEPIQRRAAAAERLASELGALPLRAWVLGIGPRTLGEVGDDTQRGASTVLEAAGKSGHLALLVENGLVGWAAMMWVIGAALVTVHRSLARLEDDGLRNLQWAALSAVVGFLVCLCGFNGFANLTIEVFFWGLIGVGVGVATQLGGARPGYLFQWRLGH